MEITKRIKLARIPYGELEVGDEYTYRIWQNLNPDGSCHVAKKPIIKATNDPVYRKDLVMAMNTTKYPPESVTWDITGIETDAFMQVLGNAGRGKISLGPLVFSESQIKTVYE